MDEGSGAWIGTNQAPRMEWRWVGSAATWSSRLGFGSGFREALLRQAVRAGRILAWV